MAVLVHGGCWNTTYCKAKGATGSYQFGLGVVTVALLVQLAMVVIARAQVAARRQAVEPNLLPAI